MTPLAKLRTLGIQPLVAKIVEYRFLLLMMLLFFTGLLLMILANPQTHFGEIVRDLGIGLFVAGTVGLGVEFFVRKEMESEFRVVVDETIDELTKPRFSAIVEGIERSDQRSLEKMLELRDFHGSISLRIEEIRHLLWNNNLREMGIRQV